MFEIPCTFMRGGTSRGPYFLASDLPSDPVARDRVLVAIMGSGHDLQIDGIGGGHPLTSKIAIVSPSDSVDADVNYLFAQASVREPVVDTSPNCGNMLAGVGPFAIEKGLVPASDPETKVRIFNVNTGKLIEAIVQTPSGAVTYEGNAAIDGVPGTAAPILLTFVDAAGAKTGRLLPTGQARDTVGGIEVSCVDMAMPMMMLRAQDVGKTGYESPEQLDTDMDFLALLEGLRREAGSRMGLGDVSGMVIPKPVLLAPPARGGTISVRYFTPLSCHRAVAATGAVGIATACVTRGSLAEEVAGAGANGTREQIDVEHPGGKIPVSLELAEAGAEIPVRRASLIRTARKLLSGNVHVPSFVKEEEKNEHALEL
jgi:2-methylaconitate cis-trans-isomerase PrpF